MDSVIFAAIDTRNYRLKKVGKRTKMVYISHSGIKKIEDSFFKNIFENHSEQNCQYLFKCKVIEEEFVQNQLIENNSSDYYGNANDNQKFFVGHGNKIYFRLLEKSTCCTFQQINDIVGIKIESSAE